MKIRRFNLDEASKIIIKEFEKRRKRNPKYSIRAYALFLGIDHSIASKFISGKLALSTKSKIKCLHKLEVDHEILKKLYEEEGSHLYEKIADHDFEAIAGWLYFAILEILTFPNFDCTIESIAKKLPVSLDETEKAIRRLAMLGFVELFDQSVRLVKNTSTFYPTKNTTQAKIDFQKELLQLSQKSLDAIPFDERDHSSVILAVSKQEMALFKEWIKSTRRQLTDAFQENKKFDEVYCLQISLFPLTKKKL